MTAPDNLATLKRLFHKHLEQSLESYASKRLHEALSYALLGEGKRLRPLLVLATALSAGAGKNSSWQKRAIPAALAVEYIHTYSLIHDDLPAMDNDDFRRGRLSTHRRFDEALAILAGDALLSDAFLLLARAPEKAAEQCAILAKAAGRHGLVAGQAEDLVAGAKDSASWLHIHAHKTASLFEASTTLGALSQSMSDKQLEPYKHFGHHFGMAFQIKDDIDDNAGLLRDAGLEKSRALLSFHVQEAKNVLNFFEKAEVLRELFNNTFGLPPAARSH